MNPSAPLPVDTVVGVKKTTLDSDVTLQQFYRLRTDPKIEYLVVTFHAEWCGQCKYVKTPEYQEGIQRAQQKYPNIRIVTLDIEAESGPAMERFTQSVVNEYMDGKSVTAIPKTLLIRNRDGRFFKEFKPPKSNFESVPSTIAERILRGRGSFDKPNVPVLPR